jgi:hypothetical protein
VTTARPPRRLRQLDVGDVLIVLGFLAFTGGTALLSVPWALILAGALLVVAGFRWR